LSALGKKPFMNSIDLSIVIVTYNSENLIEECIDSIYNTTKKTSVEVVVSDNSENDNTEAVLKKLQKKYASLSFIHNKDNLGFSKANNIGIKKTSGTILLFLNPDTKVYENTIDGMYEFMLSHENAGAATCFVELPNKKLDDSAHRGFPTPWNSFAHFTYLARLFPKVKLFTGYNLTYLGYTHVHEIDACAGSFMLVPRSVGEKLGWWDEDYFFYGEDLDFCFRIKEIGKKIYFVPEFGALHYKGVSSGIKKVSKGMTEASKNTVDRATNARFEAMEIFYRKHYRNRYPSFVKYLVLMGIKTKWYLAKLQNR